MRIAAVVQVVGLIVLGGESWALARRPTPPWLGQSKRCRPGIPRGTRSTTPRQSPLDAAGYVEEEFFVDGTANRYATSDLETGSVVDGGHPYRSRFIVRRPPAEHFNGVVMVEWFNVTGGPDKDIDWWLSGHHFVREGYAFIAVSAQQVGIKTLKELSPQRSGTFDVSDGMVKRDGLSYDVFSVVAKAVLRPGEQPAPGAVDILRGLRAETLIATGHSQSARRLATYFNNVHPLDPIFNGGDAARRRRTTPRRPGCAAL